MQHFLRTQPPADTTNSVVFNQRPTYIEVLIQSLDRKVWFSCYIIPQPKGENAGRDGASAAAIICWDRQFDSTFEYFSNPKYGRIWTDAYRGLWPTFFQLMDNAVHGNYEDGALAEMTDPDDGKQKWFFAVVVHGLGADFSAPGAVDKATKAADRVVQLGLRANAEFQRQLSWSQKIRVGLRGGAAGAKEGQAVANPWRERLDWLRLFVGG